MTIAILIMNVGKVNAKSVTITSQTYSTRVYNRVQQEYSWASYTNNGTQQTWDTDAYYLKGFRTKLYSSSKFDSGTTYTAKIRANTTPKGTYELFRPDAEFTCYGSVSNSNYNAQTSLIGICQLVSIVIESDNNFTDYYINFTPTANIETVQFVILWGASLPISRINIDNTSTITYDTSTQDAINSQTNSLINNQNNNTTSIINNQDSNTTEIINNQNSNTQDIIDNQNANNQAQINSQKICEHYDKSKIKVSGYYLNTQGNASASNNYGVTEYIKIVNAEIKEITHLDTTSQSSMCFYNVNHTLISCIRNNNIGSTINIPSGAYYVMFSINKNEDKPQFEVCKNGNQGITDTLDQNHEYNSNQSETIQGQQDIDTMQDKENQIMNSIDVSGANNLNVNINSNASNFIWAIAQRLREMNEKIVLLFTSILGLGVMKTILNR